MTKKNMTSLFVGLFVAGALTVGCSSKQTEVTETTPANDTIASSSGSNTPTTTVAQANLGASSSGYSR